MITVKFGDEVKEVQFDLDKLTVKEYRALFDKGTNKDYEDELLSRVTGISQEELASLTLKDYKRVFQNFVKAAVNPLSDPS